MNQGHRIETVINGHYVNKNHYFSLKSYQWRVRHHKIVGKKNLAIGQPKPVLVIITGIHTLTEPADRQAARQLKTVKTITTNSVKDLDAITQNNFEQYLATHSQGDPFYQPQQ